MVRNLTSNALRRDLRRGDAPDSLEVVADQAAPGADPAAQAVTSEEETLLWRAAVGMPRTVLDFMRWC